MSFAEIAAEKVPVVGCTIGTIVASLPEDEAKVVTDMLAANLDTWPHSGGTKPKDSIQLAFRAEGYEVGEKAIRAHRVAACKCYRDGS